MIGGLEPAALRDPVRFAPKLYQDFVAFASKAGLRLAPKLELFNNATGTKLNENVGWGGSAMFTAAFTSD